MVKRDNSWWLFCGLLTSWWINQFQYWQSLTIRQAKKASTTTGGDNGRESRLEKLGQTR